MKRIFLIVLDSVGVGELPDAHKYGDQGSDTLGACARSGRLRVPNMKKLGLFHIDGLSQGEVEPSPVGSYGKMAEKSAGKDTTIGHWEIAGVVSPKPLPTYPDGFPPEILRAFEEKTGRGILCNRPYSGTDVIRDFGQQHVESGDLIVYTSADSVFQVAAHEDVVPVKQLYEYCEIAREMLRGEHGVGRVIARPFLGIWPNFVRTINRHDFSLKPPKETILDALAEAGKEVIGVGKIYDIFAGKGITRTFKNEGNEKNMVRVLDLQAEDFEGLCFVNLVDFDMLYGHRNDVAGYTDALNAFDSQLGLFLDRMREEDVLIITADHGCDPSTSSTDHSREYTPCLCFGNEIRQGQNLQIRESFADIGAAIGEAFGLDYRGDGESFWSLVRMDRGGEI